MQLNTKLKENQKKKKNMQLDQNTIIGPASCLHSGSLACFLVYQLVCVYLDLYLA